MTVDGAGLQVRIAALRRGVGAALVALLAAACSEDATRPEPSPLPPTFQLVGSAEHAQDGWTLQCRIDATVDATRETGSGWTGTLLGHVVRTVVDPDGTGWEFDALVASSAFDVVEGPDGVVSVPLGGDQPPDAAAFWKALSPLLGEEESEWSYTGPWTCLGLDAPFDPRPGLEGLGTWRLAASDGAR